MNTNLLSALSAIFVVIKSAGRYDDHTTTLVQSFSTRQAADRFCTSKESEIRRLEGMAAAVNAMMGAWEVRNPWKDQDGYHVARQEEQTRLEKITGYSDSAEAADLKWHDAAEVGYYVQEVPFS